MQQSATDTEAGAASDPCSRFAESIELITAGPGETSDGEASEGSC
jgi:hypothetical protein